RGDVEPRRRGDDRTRSRRAEPDAGREREGDATMTTAIVAPTDAQLGYIASLCREWGWQPPRAVHSKQEASEIIAAMQDGSYAPERYAPDGDLPDVLRAS